MHNPPNIISVITVYNEKCFFFLKRGIWELPRLLMVSFVI